MRARFGARVDREPVARLHELTEGWPLGLQLALSVMAARQRSAGRGRGDGGASAARCATSSSNLLLANLDPADVAFLTRIAILDNLHPELCRAVVPAPTTRPSGWRAWRATRRSSWPARRGDWLRMHALARDELRRRFAQLPADEQAALHARAADWLAGHGLLEAAARMR